VAVIEIESIFSEKYNTMDVVVMLSGVVLFLFHICFWTTMSLVAFHEAVELCVFLIPF